MSVVVQDIHDQSVGTVRLGTQMQYLMKEFAQLGDTLATYICSVVYTLAYVAGTVRIRSHSADR
jgi:hypothetical protein